MSRRLVDGQMPVQRKGARRNNTPIILNIEPDLINRVEAALKMGNRVEVAFALQGVHPNTVRNWILLGHEQPDSEYGLLIRRIFKAMAEYEFRDLAVLEAHAQGRPAQYEMEVVRDKDGSVVKDADGKVVMQVARTKDGNPIVRVPAIKSDWRAAVERLSRRLPKWWARSDEIERDLIMGFDNKKPETKEALTFEQKVADTYKRLEEDV